MKKTSPAFGLSSRKRLKSRVRGESERRTWQYFLAFNCSVVVFSKTFFQSERRSNREWILAA
jgi:hypothetical protein